MSNRIDSQLKYGGENFNSEVARQNGVWATKATILLTNFCTFTEHGWVRNDASSLGDLHFKESLHVKVKQ